MWRINPCQLGVEKNGAEVAKTRMNRIYRLKVIHTTYDRTNQRRLKSFLEFALLVAAHLPVLVSRFF